MDTVILESQAGAFEVKTSLSGQPVDQLTRKLTRKNGEMVVEFQPVKDEKTEKVRFLAEVPTEITLRDVRGKDFLFHKNYAQDLLNAYKFLKVHKIIKKKLVESPVVVEPEEIKKEAKNEEVNQ